MSKIAQTENRVLARAVRTRSQIAERERFIQYRAKARFQALLRRLSLKLTANLRHKKSRRNR